MVEVIGRDLASGLPKAVEVVAEERSVAALRTSNLIVMEGRTVVPLAAPSATPASTSDSRCAGRPCHVARYQDRGMLDEVAFPPSGDSPLRSRVA